MSATVTSKDKAYILDNNIPSSTGQCYPLYGEGPCSRGEQFRYPFCQTAIKITEVRSNVERAKEQTKGEKKKMRERK